MARTETNLIIEWLKVEADDGFNQEAAIERLNKATDSNVDRGRVRQWRQNDSPRRPPPKGLYGEARFWKGSYGKGT